MSYIIKNKEIKIFEVDRKKIENIKFPMIEVRTNGIVKQIIMLEISSRNGKINYTSGSGQTLTLDGPNISKTNGFDINLISMRIIGLNPFNNLLPKNFESSEYIREYKFLYGSTNLKTIKFQCKLFSIEKNNITISSIDYDLTRFDENCKGNGIEFTNRFYSEDNGLIRTSKQWIYKDKIFATYYILKPE